jgi:hypothetical protein
MPSVSLRCGYRLLLILLVAAVSVSCGTEVVLAKGTVVQPKNLEYQENEWTSTEAKHESGRFDNLVAKGNKQTALAATETSTDAPANEGGSHWVWGVLGSLFVAGAGLTCFGYYWSNMRRVASW